MAVLRDETRGPKREGTGGLLPSGSFRQAGLGESCHSVRPGLHIRADCIILVGGDGDPVAAEVHHVELAVRVVAPEGCAEGIAPDIMDHSAAVGRGDRSGGKQRSHASVETGKRVELVVARADGLGQCVLVDHLRGVGLLGHFDRRVALTGSHIRYTLKGIVGYDRLDDRVERRNIHNGFCKGAGRTLDICTLYEICHSSLPPLGPWAEYYSIGRGG